MHDETATTASVRSRPLYRCIAFVCGLALLIAAVVAVSKSSRGFALVRDSLREESIGTLAGVVGLAIASWLLTTVVFYTLTARHTRVAWREMLALIGSSWLLNFLPLSPGLLGRIAYHRRVHKVPVAISIRVVIQSILLGWAAAASLAGVCLLHQKFGGWVTPVGVFVGAYVVVWAIGAGVERARGKDWKLGMLWCAAIAKLADMTCWCVRYTLLLWLVGVELTHLEGIALALVAQTVMLVPLIGNGIGVREWAVGSVAAMLPAWALGGTAPEAVSGVEVGLAADLIGRAVEVMVAVPVGLGSAWWLASRHKGPQTASLDSSGAEHGPTS